MRPDRTRLRVLLAGLAATAAVLILTSVPPTGEAVVKAEERVQALVYDWAGSRSLDDRVLVVGLDEAAYQTLGRPVMRRFYGRLLEAFADAGVAAVGWDIFLVARPYDGEEGERAFVQGAEALGRNVMMINCDSSSGGLRPGEDRLLSAWGLDASMRAPSCPVPNLPWPALLEGSSLAAVQLAPSAAGYLRGVLPFIRAGDHVVPSLSVALFMVGEGLDAGDVEPAPGGLRLGARRIRLGADGVALSSYRQRSVVPLSTLLPHLPAEGPARFPPEYAAELRGKYVILGLIENVDGDFMPDAAGRPSPAVFVHANFLSDLLEDRMLRDVSHGAQLLLMLFIGLGMVAAVIWMRPRNAALLALLFVIGSVYLAVLLLQRGWLAPIVAPSVTSLVVLIAAMTVRLTQDERQRRLLLGAFGAYVHPGVLKRILQNPSGTLALEGARKEVTVLFSDIVGYTRISNLAPEIVIGALREYMAQMSTLVTRHGGRVDKIMGDGLMAVFGDPVDDPQHAASAVAAALEMQAAAAGLPSPAGGSLAVRIGIATGEVYVGNIGAAGSKIEYTVLGPTVNLASRLEARATPGGVLVSQATQAACVEGFEFERVEGLVLKGFEGPVTAWAVRSTRRAPETGALRAGRGL